MSVLLPRNRLAAVMSRLESPFDGERAAAGLIASKIIRDAGMTWADLINAATMHTYSTPVRAVARPSSTSWRNLLAVCRRCPELLTDWEVDFVVSVGRQRRLTRKQWAILAKIASKVCQEPVS